MASVLKRLVALAICISFPIFLLCKIVSIVLGKEELVIFDIRMQASVESEITTTAPLICTTSFSSTYVAGSLLLVPIFRPLIWESVMILSQRNISHMFNDFG